MATSPSSEQPSAWGRIFYGLTIFLGAYLVFQIQPLIGKIITPRYGGIAAVWCLCLLFFQACLLGGYSLTFVLSRLGPRLQAAVYLVLLGGSLLFLNIPTGREWVPADLTQPIGSLLGQLTRYLALPCILLSAISGLLQNWYRIARYGDPYPLYSISNLGSLGALILYPTVIEPYLSTSNTVAVWKVAYGILFAVALVAVGLLWFRADKLSSAAPEESPAEKPGWNDMAWWVGLSMAGCTLLIGFTNLLTQELAPIPLLWIIPLSLYLLTFILAFSDRGTYYRREIYLAWAPLVTLAFLFIYVTKLMYLIPSLLSIALIGATLFWLCMVCHGEIYARKPAPVFLPGYYLAVALGGVLGGLFVNIAAPFLFKSYFELDLALFFMLGFALYAQPVSGINRFATRLHRAARQLYPVLLAVFLTVITVFSPVVDLYKERNFYGVVTVRENQGLRMMLHGNIVHGLESTRPGMVGKPLLYFEEGTGVDITNRLVRAHRQGQPLNLGVIGLGVGAMAAYTQPGDRLIYYEIDQKVEDAARRYFSFLPKARAAEVDVIIGDGRTSIERQPPQHYDLLFIDAFNGDACPVHLITREAFELYLTHIKPDGVLMFQTTNGYVNLPAVIGNVAGELGLKAYVIQTGPIKYVVASRDPWLGQALKAIADDPAARRSTVTELGRHPGIGVWTDNYSNLFSALKFGI